MVALYTVWYNFVRIHKTLRVTPAVAGGVSERLWEMADVVALSDARPLQAQASEDDGIMLPPDWCRTVICPNVDLAKPGIYRWEIEEAGVYIGKYTRSSRPTKEYRRNVVRILTGGLSHHRNGKFRRIHDELAKAVQDGRRITLTILVNAEKPDLNRIEREFIRSEGANLNGPVLRLPDLDLDKNSN